MNRILGALVGLDWPSWCNAMPGGPVIAIGVLTAWLLLLGACAPQRATKEDCEAILLRIVALELTEQGYRDPTLVHRKQVQALRTFAPELAACVGRRLPDRALACIAEARTTESLVHGCLRR